MTMITRSMLRAKKNQNSIAIDWKRNSSVVPAKRKPNDRKVQGSKKQKIRVIPLDEIALLHKRNKARLAQMNLSLPLQKVSLPLNTTLRTTARVPIVQAAMESTMQRAATSAKSLPETPLSTAQSSE